MKTQKRKKLWITAIAALCMVAFIGGCKKDKYVPIVGVCPVVQSTDPADHATNVPRNKIITVTFNEKMNPATITQESFILSQGVNKISGALTYDGTGLSMSFAPTNTLLPHTIYSGRVTTAVKDAMGNALQTDYLWSFTTGSVVITQTPAVISTDPANNATGVALNKVISANFSEQMDPSTINALTFLIKQGANSIAGTITYNGTTAYFTPTSIFSPGVLYTATIKTGAKDLAGNALQTDYVWNFTTGTSTVFPVVIATDPVNNESAVALNKVITATFSEQMDPLTITPLTFMVKQGTVTLGGTVAYAGTTATFTPSSNLVLGTIYKATITTGAKDLAGNPMTNNYSWNFNTIVRSSTVSAVGVDLKTVGRFGIIAGVGVSNDAGFSEIHNMDVGISPGVRSSITGFPPAIVVNGAIYASDDVSPPGTAAMLTQAKQDLTDAYLFAEGAVSPAPSTVSGDLGGTTLAPGIYKTTSSLLIQSGDLTLDAQGDANAVWIFQIASAFTTVGGAGGNVILSGGAQAKNVFWQTGSSATIGDFTSFQGNILALTSITMNSGAVAVGRMLCRNGSVVMTSTNIIDKP